MPYIQPIVTHDARFTPQQADDLKTACDLLIEKWELFYPQFDYLMIDYVATVPADNGGETLVTGVRPGTVVDPLYGEAIPTRDLGGGQWETTQPHGTSVAAMATDAPVRKRHLPAVPLHVHVRRNEQNPELRLEGANPSRDFTLTVPTPVLDKHGVVVKPGDRMQLGINLIEVKEARMVGYWKHTNIPLYVRMEACLEARGS
jgi:hypothetical protein